ncbi:MAG: T9SS type A sorting domain-containing protein, partial [Hymenobacter sp.]
GQGSKASATSYAFTDAGIGLKLAAGQAAYYRLNQVDQDGTATYSPVRSLRFGETSALVPGLYPNPAATGTTLDLSALPATASYQLRVLDAVGRPVQQATLPGGQATRLDLGSLAPGTYQLLLTGPRADGSALRQLLRLTRE